MAGASSVGVGGARRPAPKGAFVVGAGVLENSLNPRHYWGLLFSLRELSWSSYWHRAAFCETEFICFTLSRNPS